MIYRILPIKRTVRFDFRKIDHPNECRLGCIGHYLTFALSLFSLDLWRYKPICNEVVDWSIAQSCLVPNMNSENMKEPQIGQNSMLASRKGKRKGM